MTRRRDVSVRMRPVSAPPDRREGSDAMAPTPPVTSGRPVSSGTLRPRRQIWDLEAEQAADTDTRAQSQPRTPSQPRAAEPDAPLILRNPVAPPSQPIHARDTAPMPDRPVRHLTEGPGADDGHRAPAPTSDTAARTRILGFRADDTPSDAIEAAGDTARDDRFPTGWLVIVDGPGIGASFTLTTSVAPIGRGADQAVRLDFGDTSISRSNHAAVAYDAEQNRFYLGHGHKSNVVRRNDQPVLTTEELADGDLIRIGKTTLRFVALCGPKFEWPAHLFEDGAIGGLP